MIRINDISISAINSALRKLWYKICCLTTRVEVLELSGGGDDLLVALPFTTDHLDGTNNEYLIGDLVWYGGNVYRCLANNDSLQPDLAPAYWVNLGAGFPLVQQPVNWNSTSGNNQILNKPIIPSVGTWGALNYPTWSSGTPFVKMTAAGNFALDTNDYVPTSRTLTINGTTQDLSADRSFTVSGSNIYNSDGSLTAARTLTLNSQPLTIAGTTSSRFFSNGNVGIGTTTDAGYKLDVFGPVRLYPRGAVNGGFEFTNNDVYNIMHSNSFIYLSSNSGMYIGGVGITMIGTNKNETLSQVTIGYFSWQGGSASASAILDIKSTTKGFLMPRMTTVEKNAIATPATSLQVFDTTNNTPKYYTGTSWANMGGAVYKTAVQVIGTSENLVTAKIREVKRLIFRGSTVLGSAIIPLTGYNPELILSLTGTFVLDANFTVSLPYSNFQYTSGDISTTNVLIYYRPSINSLQITAESTYAGSSSAINSSYVAIIEFQEN